MKKSLSNFVSRATLAVLESLVDKSNIRETRTKLVSLVSAIRDKDFELNDFERSRLVECAMFMRARNANILARYGKDRLVARLTGVYEQGLLEKCANSVESSATLRRKKKKVKDLLSTTSTPQRSANGSTDPNIFFLCSWHQLPAKGHKSLQGRLYANRYWRSIMKKQGFSSFIPAVEKKIKKDNIITVQASMRYPLLLVVRPYCMHFFVPIPFFEAMFGSHKDILRRHPEARMHAHRSKTYFELYNERRQRRLKEKREALSIVG